MKRSHKFYKKKEILRRKREADQYRSQRSSHYWDYKGYRTRLILSREGKKHPLHQEIEEILPLVSSIVISDTLDYPEIVSNNIEKALYLKLSSTQKMCFTRHEPGFEEYVDAYTHHQEVYVIYELADFVKKLLVPYTVKNYIRGYSFALSHESAIGKKMIRDHIYGRHRYREIDPLGRQNIRKN
jgi:hypothetical protein